MSVSTQREGGTKGRGWTPGPNLDYAIRFAWGYRNYVGGSDDWRCDAIREYDEFDNEIDDDRDPCECAECAGATARAHDHGKPSLSTRVKLNLAATATATSEVER